MPVRRVACRGKVLRTAIEEQVFRDFPLVLEQVMFGRALGIKHLQCLPLLPCRYRPY